VAAVKLDGSLPGSIAEVFLSLLTGIADVPEHNVRSTAAEKTLESGSKQRSERVQRTIPHGTVSNASTLAAPVYSFPIIEPQGAPIKDPSPTVASNFPLAKPVALSTTIDKAAIDVSSTARLETRVASAPVPEAALAFALRLVDTMPLRSSAIASTDSHTIVKPGSDSRPAVEQPQSPTPESATRTNLNSAEHESTISGAIEPARMSQAEKVVPERFFASSISSRPTSDTPPLGADCGDEKVFGFQKDTANGSSGNSIRTSITSTPRYVREAGVNPTGSSDLRESLRAGSSLVVTSNAPVKNSGGPQTPRVTRPVESAPMSGALQPGVTSSATVTVTQQDNAGASTAAHVTPQIMPRPEERVTQGFSGPPDALGVPPPSSEGAEDTPPETSIPAQPTLAATSQRLMRERPVTGIGSGLSYSEKLSMPRVNFWSTWPSYGPPKTLDGIGDPEVPRSVKPLPEFTPPPQSRSENKSAIDSTQMRADSPSRAAAVSSIAGLPGPIRLSAQLDSEGTTRPSDEPAGVQAALLTPREPIEPFRVSKESASAPNQQSDPIPFGKVYRLEQSGSFSQMFRKEPSFNAAPSSAMPATDDSGPAWHLPEQPDSKPGVKSTKTQFPPGNSDLEGDAALPARASLVFPESIPPKDSHIEADKAPITQHPAVSLPDLPATNAVSHASPINDISVRVASEESPPVDVRLVDREGSIRVAVRTPDADLARNMQAGLNDLVQRLEHKGFQTEAWSPSATPIKTHDGSLQGDRSPHADTGGGSFDGSAGNQQAHDRENGRNRPKWVNELERSISTDEGGYES